MGVIWESGNLWVNIALGLVAMALLVASADEVVKRLVGLAEYFELSATFMGMTVLSLATSIPEISSHMTASVGILTGSLDYQQSSAIVLGANIGSDVVQQTLILGIVVFLSGGLVFRRYFWWKSIIPMIVTTLMCLILGWDQSYSRLDGLILFGTFVGYTYYLYVDERKYFSRDEAQERKKEGVPQSGKEAVLYALIAVGGMVITVLSASIVLHVTEFVVDRTGIGGSLIGVMTLGIASALPELTTALAGVRSKAQGISMGTLVGSNITNPLVAIGGGALVSGYWVPRPLIHWDLPWETLTGLALLVILILTKGRLSKMGAIYLMVLYVVYMVGRAVFFASDAYI
ncbi:MAG: sodium:calcium antiporter [Anaerolineae bacterium]